LINYEQTIDSNDELPPTGRLFRLSHKIHASVPDVAKAGRVTPRRLRMTLADGSVNTLP
jgi:hypothetical protein